jgi:hypothetical protein
MLNQSHFSGFIGMLNDCFCLFLLTVNVLKNVVSIKLHKFVAKYRELSAEFRLGNLKLVLRMEHSALTELFNALSAGQLRSARAWVESPLFNRREAPLRLFDYLAECRNEGSNISQKDAIEYVFDSNKGDVALLRHEMSTLSKLLRDFLVWQEMNQMPGQHEWLLLRAMRKMGLGKNFQLATREAEKALSRAENQTIDRHLLAFRLGTEQYEWEEGQKRGREFPFAPLHAELDNWYAGQLLQLACTEQSRQNIRRDEVSRSASNQRLDELLNLLPTKPHQNIPGIAIYYLGKQMLAAPENSEAMEAYREMLAQYLHTTPTAEARDLLMLAINHGIRRINAGDKMAIRNTLGFYLLGLEKKLLHDEQGRLSKYTYNNILMTFLALEEWPAAAEFLERYRAELPVQERDNIFHYNLAIYHFRRGDYDAALELLRDVTFSDTMYKLESRKMLLKIYYEQEAISALESLLENLLLWLRRHGEIGYQREMYRNLARFTGQLLRLMPGASDARKRLEKKIMETPLVAERAWLLEKVRR